MTHEYSSTDAGTAHDAETSAIGEQALYGEPRHEVRDDRDEQALYGDPQHESSDEIADVWDIELLFADVDFAPAGPDELGARTDLSPAESSQR